MTTQRKPEQVSRRAPSLAAIGLKLREAVRQDAPALRTSTVAREVRARKEFSPHDS